MKTRILAVVVCLITMAAFGQSNPKLKEVQYFVGTWQCTGVAFASPMGPEHPTKATVHGSWVLGGAWLELHYAETKTAKNPHPVDVRVFRIESRRGWSCRDLGGTRLAVTDRRQPGFRPGFACRSSGSCDRCR